MARNCHCYAKLIIKEDKEVNLFFNVQLHFILFVLALNVNMLAETCGYNQKRLNEILKLKLGLSLVNVILEVKLLKAYELIVKNKFPTIKEVMFSVGINSRPYFYKKFNERFGIKIGELKNKYSQLS